MPFCVDCGATLTGRFCGVCGNPTDVITANVIVLSKPLLDMADRDHDQLPVYKPSAPLRDKDLGKTDKPAYIPAVHTAEPAEADLEAGNREKVSLTQAFQSGVTTGVTTGASGLAAKKAPPPHTKLDKYGFTPEQAKRIRNGLDPGPAEPVAPKPVAPRKVAARFSNAHIKARHSHEGPAEPVAPTGTAPSAVQVPGERIVVTVKFEDGKIEAGLPSFEASGLVGTNVDRDEYNAMCNQVYDTTRYRPRPTRVNTSGAARKAPPPQAQLDLCGASELATEEALPAHTKSGVQLDQYGFTPEQVKRVRDGLDPGTSESEVPLLGARRVAARFSYPHSAHGAATNSDLNAHIKVKHSHKGPAEPVAPRKVAARFSCPQCAHGAVTNSDLNAHIKIKHSHIHQEGDGCFVTAFVLFFIIAGILMLVNENAGDYRRLGVNTDDNNNDNSYSSAPAYGGGVSLLTLAGGAYSMRRRATEDAKRAEIVRAIKQKTARMENQSWGIHKQVNGGCCGGSEDAYARVTCYRTTAV